MKTPPGLLAFSGAIYPAEEGCREGRRCLHQVLTTGFTGKKPAEAVTWPVQGRPAETGHWHQTNAVDRTSRAWGAVAASEEAALMKRYSPGRVPLCYQYTDSYPLLWPGEGI